MQGFRQFLDSIGLGGVFGKSVEAEPVEEAVQLPTMKAAFLPEIQDEQGPLLHVLSTKSTGVIVAGEPQEDITDEAGNVIVDGSDVSLGFPENSLNRVIQIEPSDTAEQIQEAVQTWETGEGVTRIGGKAGIEPDAKHVVTFVPEGFTSETILERMILDSHSTEADWAFFRDKVEGLKSGNTPQPLAER